MIRKILLLSILSSLVLANDCFYYYKVGQIDKEIDISKNYLKTVLLDIEKEWESSINFDFLKYDDSKGTPINLVYNKNVSKYEYVNEHIDKHKAIGLELKEEQEYISSQHQYLNMKKNRLEEKIKEINNKISKNRISKYRYKVLSNEIKDEQTYLNNEFIKYNKFLRKYNTRVDDYKDYLEEINQYKKRQKLNNHEKRGVTVLQKETLTKTDIFGKVVDIKENTIAKKIDIFRLNSISEMKVIIAHEIGHMIGLKHTNQEYSLMHPIIQENQINDLRITEVDKDMLKSLLKKQCFNQ